MRKVARGRLSVFEFESFSKYTEITHFITTSEGWFSGKKPRFTGDRPEVYEKYRKELAVSLDESVEQFIFPRQNHSDNVALVISQNMQHTIADTDALITNESELFVCVQTADCVPILLFDPVRKVVAAIHAGWRGTVSKIALKTIQRMTEVFGTDPADLVAGIGPSIHIHAYEIGPEVVQLVENNFSITSQLLKPSLNKGKAFFDLWEANRQVLLEAGLIEENIELLGLCSYEHSGLFFSARRDGPDTGRMVSGIKLNGIKE